MIYTVDDGQLLMIWTVTRLLGEIREIPEPKDRSEILTEAQALLTAFVLELKPSPRDQANPIRMGTGRRDATTPLPSPPCPPIPRAIRPRPAPLQQDSLVQQVQSPFDVRLAALQ
jgi:hypothetical protein